MLITIIVRPYLYHALLDRWYQTMSMRNPHWLFYMPAWRFWNMSFQAKIWEKKQRTGVSVLCIVCIYTALHLIINPGDNFANSPILTLRKTVRRKKRHLILCYCNLKSGKLLAGTQIVKGKMERKRGYWGPHTCSVHCSLYCVVHCTVSLYCAAICTVVHYCTESVAGTVL